MDWTKPIESPIDAYPGTVTLPAHFTMPHFRAWRATNERLRDVETAEDFTLCVTGSFANGSDEKAPFAKFDPRLWAHVLAVADIQLENLPDDALTDESGESTPIEVLGWLVPMVVDGYLPEKLNLKN